MENDYVDGILEFCVVKDGLELLNVRIVSLEVYGSNVDWINFDFMVFIYLIMNWG